MCRAFCCSFKYWFNKPYNIADCFDLEVKKKFEEKRKYHYNEYSKVKLARKLIEQELKDLEDDDDDTDSKKEQPSSSAQTDADTQVR